MPWLSLPRSHTVRFPLVQNNFPVMVSAQPCEQCESGLNTHVWHRLGVLISCRQPLFCPKFQTDGQVPFMSLRYGVELFHAVFLYQGSPLSSQQEHGVPLPPLQHICFSSTPSSKTPLTSLVSAPTEFLFCSWNLRF